jgi:hypothetical protein
LDYKDFSLLIAERIASDCRMVLIDEKVCKIYSILKIPNFDCYWLPRHFPRKKVEIEEKRGYWGVIGNFDDSKWLFEAKA